MQVSILQDRFYQALTAVSKAIDARPPLPVLANILIDAEDSRLRVVASNLQMSITIWIGAKVDRPGSITLPARTLTDLVGRLSKERVDLMLDEMTNTISLRCAATVSTIKGIAATEYPPVKVSENEGFTIPGKTLKSMILQTVFAAAKEDNRPILTGVYLRVEGDVLTLAAADGYRLAVRTARLDESLPKTVEMVIPAKTLLEVARLIEDDQPVSIALPNNNHIVTFRLPNVDISSQLVDGRFPDFAAIIPQRHVTEATCNTQEWLKKCQTAEIFARDDAHSGLLKIVPPKGLGLGGEIIIAGRSAERGHADNRLDAAIEGSAVEGHFDIRYLIEVLNVIDEECVVFQSNGTDSPGVIRPQGREDFVFVVMPMTR
jgi:DNA polymerase-3 subunit beta